MRVDRSFRNRVLIGAILGGAGLLALTHVITSVAVLRYQEKLRLAHSTMVCVLAVGCIVAGVSQIRRGMSPFSELRERLSAVREGRAGRVEGRYPDEVQPLVSDLNALLAHREEIVRRAQAKAGDLAHGLKTPLAVLRQEAERAKANGHDEIAATIGQQVERMQRYVQYHLAQARVAGSGATAGVHCSIRESVDGLVRTLTRLHAGRDVTVEVNIPAAHTARCEREDLDEMLGNLLDNAFKWTRSRVTVQSATGPDGVTIVIEDDGAGLDESMKQQVLQRGVRADEAEPGFGLGLAIVRDIAELYGGSITLTDSSLGGLRACLRLSSTPGLGREK